MSRLSLLFTSDLHGRLTVRQAERLRALREEHAALLLDGGDAVSAGNIFYWPWVEPVLQRMNLAGYAAMGAGNREFFFRARGMRRKLRGAGFPIVASNLVTREGHTGLGISAELGTAGGERVGVLSLMPEMIPPGSWGERFSDLRFVPWEEAAGRAAAALRPRVNWLVALSHLPEEDTLRLACVLPGLDLILAGHVHPARWSSRLCGSTPIVCATAYAREVLLVQSRAASPPGHLEVEAIAI